MKKVAVIGATGSIGKQAIDVMSRLEGFSLSLISSHHDIEGLLSLANLYRVPVVCYTGSEIFPEEKLEYPCLLFTGSDALTKGAEEADYDIFLNSVVGIAALKPTLIAMEKGARIALSNKEMLVSAGAYVMKRAKELGSEIIPVDSEHSAIFQCLTAGRAADLDALIITSSGGAFRDVPLDRLDQIDPNEALSHPNWNMGKKITVDCATMMNKGFEVIEAMHLFAVPIDEIETVLHRESVVHSMVRFRDGSVIAQMASPDMRLPIQYALTYPNRAICPVKPLPLPLNLSFEKVDEMRYPCFKVALDAATRGGLYPAAMMAADSILVPAYLQGRIKYSDIPAMLCRVLDHFSLKGAYDLSDVFYINNEAEKYTRLVVDGEV